MTSTIIHSMHQYAKKLDKSSIFMPQIFWLDTKKYTELLYKGRYISLSQLQSMVAKLQEKLVNQFKDSEHNSQR